MKKIFQILIIVCAGLVMNSCYYDELQEEVIPIITDEVSFTTDIQAIFNANNCMECHNASRNPDLRIGQAYSSLVPEYVVANDAEASLLYNKLVGGHRNLGTEPKALIKAWIDQGAKNN